MKLANDKLLSSFAFRVNLRHYITGLKPGAEDGTPGGDSLSGRFGMILGINGDSASDALPAAAAAAEAEVSGEDRVGLGRCCSPRHSSH